MSSSLQRDIGSNGSTRSQVPSCNGSRDARSDPPHDIKITVQNSNRAVHPPPSRDDIGCIALQDQLGDMNNDNHVFKAEEGPPEEGRQAFLCQRDQSHGPIKKRQKTPPSLLRRNLTRTVTSPLSSEPSVAFSSARSRKPLSIPPVVPRLLSSSSSSVSSHPSRRSLDACLTISSDQRLIAQPLFQTPVDANTSPSAAWGGTTSGGSFPGIGFATSQSNGVPIWTPLPSSPLHHTTDRADPKPSRAVLGSPRETAPKRSIRSRAVANSHLWVCPSPLAQPVRPHPTGGQPPIRDLGYNRYSSLHPPIRGLRNNMPEVPRQVVGTLQHVHKMPSSPTRQVMSRRKAPLAYLPPVNPMVTAFPVLFRDAVRTTKACRCGHSKCLKLYCECFHNGFLCDEKLCRCKDCKNNPKENTPQGEREYAILKIIRKRPNAFTPKVLRTGKCCKCKKSHCLLKYCECYAGERKCTGECSCRNCRNVERGK